MSPAFEQCLLLPGLTPLKIFPVYWLCYRDNKGKVHTSVCVTCPTYESLASPFILVVSSHSSQRKVTPLGPPVSLPPHLKQTWTMESAVASQATLLWLSSVISFALGSFMCLPPVCYLPSLLDISDICQACLGQHRWPEAPLLGCFTAPSDIPNPVRLFLLCRRWLLHVQSVLPASCALRAAVSAPLWSRTHTLSALASHLVHTTGPCTWSTAWVDGTHWGDER